MTEVEKVIITSATTLIGGAFLVVFGQIASKLFIDPLVEIRKTIGQIAFTLVFRADVMLNAPVANTQELFEARVSFRQLSSQLRSNVNTLPCYQLFWLLLFLPRKKKAIEASRLLIRLSNTHKNSSVEKINDDCQAVARLLGIDQNVIN